MPALKPGRWPRPVAPAGGPPEQPGLSAREGQGHRRKEKVGMHKAGKSIEKARPFYCALRLDQVARLIVTGLFPILN